VLIGFDLLLVLVVGRNLRDLGPRPASRRVSSMSAASPRRLRPARRRHRAVGHRRPHLEFGFSPNKVAAWVNLILLVNLGWSAVLYGRILARRVPFRQLERWQTAFLPVYAV
jgi:hypothetical protein